jgi:hypothetical protein
MMAFLSLKVIVIINNSMVSMHKLSIGDKLFIPGGSAAPDS